MSAFLVREAVTEEDRRAAFAVRREVFVGEQGVPEEIEYDALDATAVHVVALGPDGTPLGAGRLLFGSDAVARTGGAEGVGSLGRLAVTRAARGLGLGAALVRAVEEAARARGLTAVDLHAQTHALGFYLRLGYQAYGEEYLEAGIPHQAMRRPL
ncbi:MULTISPECIES: GNAT family N-acetyltransferase [Streptomyces]|uniref:GNAT family N-acetyltransferase n=1 Tax=Streptomyces lichenis TaxID=2306967 RepID=A0ABT0IGI8_9ACTN|nr:GNAT family N-acetyltransferase [Streptomyces lichenis]MCK8680453.1 GNAT family N-acetyltransferase [Streptomyces lichenis]